MTQDGIATGLSLSRAHVALELKRLKTSGRVGERMAHVAHARSRRKVYDLTSSGQEIARKMRDHARSRTVQLNETGGLREVPGSEAIEALRRTGLRESDAVQHVLAADVIEVPRPEGPKAEPPGRPFFGRADEQATLRAWLDSSSNTVAMVIGVAGIGKSTLIAHVLEGERRPTFARRVYAHDDPHGLLSSFADFLARQGRRRLKAVITRPAYDPVEAIAVLRSDLSGCIVAIDDLHTCPAADALLRPLVEDPVPGKILIASRVHPTFYERADVLRGRVVEMTLSGLDEAASEELLRSRGAPIEADALHRVVASTHGHPFALELFAASGLDGGAVETERYVLETVLDGLDDSSEELLRTFAVLRRPARSPEALGATLSQLRRLVRRALLHHRDDWYLIHDLVKEFFLRRLGEAARREAHGRAAEYWLFRSDGLEEAYHRIEAGDLETAKARLTEIGPALAESARAGDLEAALLRVPRTARLEGILAEAAAFLGKFDEARAALERIGASGGEMERLRARIHLGRIQNRLGAYKEARGVLEAAVQEAARLNSPEIEGEALRALGGVERKLGDLEPAVRHLVRAAEVLERLAGTGPHLDGPRRGPDRSRRHRRSQGPPPGGGRDGPEGDERRGRDPDQPGHRHEQGRRRAGGGRDLARSADMALATGEIRFAAYALANAVDSLLRLEAIDEAASSAERALALASTIGDPVALSQARANLGLVFARRGEWAKAEEHLLGSVEIINRLDNPYSLATRYEELARLYEAQGRGGDAASWRSRAEGLYARLQGNSKGTASP